MPDDKPKPKAMPMLCDRDEGAQLRALLEEVLSIPKHARSFTVKFERSQAVIVTVDYIPHVRQE